MEAPSIRLDASVPIPVLEPLRVINAALLDLLRSFTTEDWHRPTIHPDRNVKDLTAHLLQTTLNRVSVARDGYVLPPAKPVADMGDLIAVIQRTNRELQPTWPPGHGEKAVALLDALTARRDLHVTKLTWASGIVIATRL